MSLTTSQTSHRERELAAIITAYNDVTEKLKQSHEILSAEVNKLRLEIEDKNKELARRERLAALGEMATGVAHEIRNPLGSIQLYASLLERDLSPIPESQKLVRKISAGVGALDRIVGDILDFAGRREIQSSPISLQVVVANAFDVAGPQAQSKDVQLLIEGPVDYEIWGDQLQLERAVLNIILNGIEAVHPGGSIRVAAELCEEERVAVLEITDDGPGVNADILERIFNPFFTTKDTGTGLGLAIVHRIVESHGGSISVWSPDSGGTCFAVRLPLDRQVQIP